MAARHIFYLDEIQWVPDFQKAVDSLFLRSNIDIYLTGSNAYMLSGEFAPLKKIPDNYPKYVLTMDEFPLGEDGIKQINIIDFLLE